jgi:hypothetical protein
MQYCRHRYGDRFTVVTAISTRFTVELQILNARSKPRNKGNREIRVILYAKEPSFHLSTLRRGRGRLLRAARPDQRPRAVGADDEHLQLPEPDPGVHRLLEGVRNLTGPE